MYLVVNIVHTNKEFLSRIHPSEWMTNHRCLNSDLEL